MLEHAQFEHEDVGLFAIGRDRRATIVRPIREDGIWTDPALTELLEEPDEVVEAAGGWSPGS